MVEEVLQSIAEQRMIDSCVLDSLLALFLLLIVEFSRILGGGIWLPFPTIGPCRVRAAIGLLENNVLAGALSRTRPGIKSAAAGRYRTLMMKRIEPTKTAGCVDCNSLVAPGAGVKYL